MMLMTIMGKINLPSKTSLASSVTRFGETATPWRIFKNLWQCISGLFGLGQSFQLTLAQCMYMILPKFLFL